ncbi:MAG: hypothetical protein O3A01_06400 [bacterium]|nr:hypothetical protein [bacterium]
MILSPFRIAIVSLIVLSTSAFAQSKQNLEFSGFLESSSSSQQNKKPVYEMYTRILLDTSLISSDQLANYLSRNIDVKGYFYLQDGRPVLKLTNVVLEEDDYGADDVKDDEGYEAF